MRAQLAGPITVGWAVCDGGRGCGVLGSVLRRNLLVIKTEDESQGNRLWPEKRRRPPPILRKLAEDQGRGNKGRCDCLGMNRQRLSIFARDGGIG